MAAKQFLVGTACTGKTTRLHQRLSELISNGTRPDRVLVLVPQPAQLDGFRAVLSRVKSNTRGEPTLTTLYGLAQQHVGLFFPRIAAEAGFAQPHREPTFMNVEVAQFFLSQILQPYLTAFEDLKLYRPRLLSQLLDSMNKAATSGFELDDIAERLSRAWAGEGNRVRNYVAAQQVAIAFREFCLKNNVLDFSLTLHVFTRHLLRSPSYQDYAIARYRHLIADNSEEGTPALHDFIHLLAQHCDSAMLAQDQPGGYRLFLGADVRSADHLRATLTQAGFDTVTTGVATHEIAEVGQALAAQFATDGNAPVIRRSSAIQVGGGKYWVQQVDWVAQQIVALVQSGVPANEIVVLAPFVEDVLRFELHERLQLHGIGVRTLRPSRPLYDHPTTRALVTLAKLAHPHWNMLVSNSELSRALAVAIADLDVIRAQLIADATLRLSAKTLSVLEDQVLWNRVGMRFRERYEQLRLWLVQRAGLENKTTPLDLFWQQLFTDLLSQQGFGLHHDFEGADVCDKLVRNARAFREAIEQSGVNIAEPDLSVAIPVLNLSEKPSDAKSSDVGLAYVNLLGEGMLAAAAPRTNDVTRENDILLATVYAYLTGDHRSQVQFWLDIHSVGWYERIYQPLTHPYVLARTADAVWTDDDEHAASFEMMRRVLVGLTARCRERLYVSSSQISISGQEEEGLLARAVQRVTSLQIQSSA